MRYWESQKRRKQAVKKSTAPRTVVANGGNLRNYPFLRTFYQHQAVISDGIQRFLFFLIVATLLYAFVFGDSGAIRLATLRHDRTQLVEDVARLNAEIEDIQGAIGRLEDDPYMMEKLGRERYGFVHPGDRVYKIVRPKEDN